MNRKPRRRKKPRRRCPAHDCELVSSDTRWGVRLSCPEPECTVACWMGSTSTPADDETRAARMKAHTAFDALWRSGTRGDGRRRSNLYAELAEYLELPPRQTHIGMFDRAMCQRVIEFARMKASSDG